MQEFIARPGYGVSFQVDGQAVLLGADRLLLRENVPLPEPLAKAAEAVALASHSPVWLALDGRAVAVMGVTDPVKPGARATVAALRAQGITVAMITGDNAHTAGAIARDLGIALVTAEVLPAGKVAAIAALRKGGGKVAFVGDDRPDCPILVDIAASKGS